jgi:hypothetical protein
MKNILAGLFVFIAANAFALDIITRDGKAYQDCAVKTVEHDGVRVVHRDGTAFLDFDDLPSAIQKQYGWTEEKSAARKAARAAEAEKQRAAIEAERKTQEAARLALEKTKADEARLKALSKEHEKQAAANAQSLQLAKEKRLQREANEREKSEHTRRSIWLYGIFSGLSFLYFLPSIIGRKKRNFAALFVLNLLGFLAWAGWVIEFFHFNLGASGIAGAIAGLVVASGVFLLPFSAVVWVVAIIWSFMSDARPQTVVQNVIVHHPPNVGPRPVVAPRAVAKAIPPPRNPPPV